MRKANVSGPSVAAAAAAAAAAGNLELLLAAAHAAAAAVAQACTKRLAAGAVRLVRGEVRLSSSNKH